jgi:hypothetical protein
MTHSTKERFPKAKRGHVPGTVNRLKAEVRRYCRRELKRCGKEDAYAWKQPGRLENIAEKRIHRLQRAILKADDFAHKVQSHLGDHPSSTPVSVLGPATNFLRSFALEILENPFRERILGFQLKQPQPRMEEIVARFDDQWTQGGESAVPALKDRELAMLAIVRERYWPAMSKPVSKTTVRDVVTTVTKAVHKARRDIKAKLNDRPIDEPETGA